MILNVVIDAKPLQIDVPDDLPGNAADFFSKLDHDMGQGWQMSRKFVDDPSNLQRCQIAADKVLSALHTENKSMLLLMAGYILTKMPGLHRLDIDTSGEIENTQFVMQSGETLGGTAP